MLENNWLNFVVLVTAQFTIYFAIGLIQRASANSLLLRVAVLSLFALPLGLLFDLYINEGNWIFRYHLGMSPIFLISNGLLSYGAAAATALLIPFYPTPISRISSRIIALSGAAVGSLLLTTFFVANAPPLAKVFLVGGAVIFFGETIYALLGRRGPLSGALAPGGALTLAVVLVASIAVGLLYETINIIWPVWDWEFAEYLPSWQVEILVITLGYFVLIHPLMLVSFLVFHKTEQTA